MISVLEATCTKQSTALRDHCSDISLLLNPLTHNPDFQPITRRRILDSSKLKEFADDNFRFDKNGRKLSKRAISPFPTVFSKGASKGVNVWEWVKRNHCSDSSLLLNPLSHNSDFQHLWKRKLYNTLWETSIFSFSHNVFYSSQHKFQFLSYFYFVISKCFEFGQG